ncbi:MAG: TonB-dependent receptor [Bacteroidales bacterium]
MTKPIAFPLSKNILCFIAVFFFIFPPFLSYGYSTVFSTSKNSKVLISSSPANITSIGKINGKVIENGTTTPLEFVNVIVLNASDNQMVGGGISDIKGNFTISNIPLNKAIYVKISYIGYLEHKTEIFTLSPSANVKNFGTIRLDLSAHSLSAVEIKGQKRMIEYSLDKKVVNVDQSLVSDGGTAVDILQNVPSVSVDDEGKISMKGSENVTILIDGRPAVLSGVGLDQIAANSIESIEIISNPSSKYNPEGTSGILNIKTKKRSNTDLNGIVSLSASSSNRYNASTNLSFGLGKVSLFTSLDLNYQERISNQSTSTHSYRSNSLYPEDNVEWEVGQSKNKRMSYGGQFQLGADWKINPKNALTASVKIGGWGNNSNNQSPYTLTVSYLDPNRPNAYIPDTQDASLAYHWLETLSNSSNSRSSFRQINASLFYRHEFKNPKEELSVNATLDYSHPFSNTTTIRTIDNYFSDYTYNTQSSHSNSTGYDFDGQINYVHPFNEKMKLEVGYQAKVRNNNSQDQQNLRIYELQDTAIHFNYTEQTHGIYANFIAEIKKFSFQIGGRMEFASMDAITVSEKQDTNFHYFYPRFYPAIHLSYKIGKIQEIQLSYTRRVNRPRAWNLNPFIDYSNYPSSISFGNPQLKPEDVHSVELNYSIFLKSASIYATVYYRRINDVIRRYTFQSEDGIRNQTSLNYTSGTNYGIDLSWEQQIFKWWRFSLSGSLYQNITKGGQADASLNTESLSYNLRFNTTFNLPLSFIIQFSCNYRGPNYWGQTRMSPNIAAELAVRKSFFKNRFNVGLRVSDLFHTQQFNRTTVGNGFETINKRKPYRSTAVFLTLSYKINQGFKKTKTGVRNSNSTNESDSNMEEM